MMRKTLLAVVVFLFLLAAGALLLLAPQSSPVSSAAPLNQTCSTYTSTEPPRFIPDIDWYGLGITSTIPVTQSGYVTSLSVTLNINIREIEDLNIWLEYPDGVTSYIFYRDVEGPNMVNTTFENGVGEYIWDATAPFTGVFEPAQDFWSGSPASGDWNLRISDESWWWDYDEGELVDWSITVCTTDSTPVVTPGPSPTPTRTPTSTPFATRTAWWFETGNETPPPGDWGIVTGTVVTSTPFVEGSQSYRVIGIGSYIAENWATDEPSGGELTFDVLLETSRNNFTVAEAANGIDGEGVHWRMYVSTYGTSRYLHLDYYDCGALNHRLLYLGNSYPTELTLRTVWNTNLNDTNSILVYRYSTSISAWVKDFDFQCPASGSEANNDYIILGPRIAMGGTPTLAPASLFDRAFIGDAQTIPTYTPTPTLVGTATSTPIATPSSFDFSTSNEGAPPGDFDGLEGTVDASSYWALDGSQSYLMQPGASYVYKTWGSDTTGGDLIFGHMLYPPTTGSLTHEMVRVSEASDGSNPNWAIRRSGSYLYLDYYDCGEINKYFGYLTKPTDATGPWNLLRIAWDTNVNDTNSIRVYTLCDAETWYLSSFCRTQRNHDNWRQAAAFQCPATEGQSSGDVVILGSVNSSALGQWMFDDFGITEASPIPTMDVTATPTRTPTATFTPTPTLTPTPRVTVAVTPVYDTHISIYTPDTPDGENVVVKEDHSGYYLWNPYGDDMVRALFAFDLTGYTPEQIRSAQVKLYVRTLFDRGFGIEVKVFRVTNQFWAEGATWNSPDFGSWGFPGMGAGIDYTWSNALAYVEIDEEGWLTLDVGTMVRDSLNDTPGYYAIMITGDGVQPLE